MNSTASDLPDRAFVALQDELHSFPQSTLRYVTDKVKLAFMLGTQHATRHL